MSSIGSDARRLNVLHRISSLLVGIMLLVFGVLGFTNNLDFFSTTGSPVLGLSTNLLLSTVSVVVGAVLVGHDEEEIGALGHAACFKFVCRYW